jgi:hypothetical protein
MVAQVIGDSEERVKGETAHYAMQYGQDGPVKIVIKPPRKRS